MLDRGWSARPGTTKNSPIANSERDDDRARPTRRPRSPAPPRAAARWRRCRAPAGRSRATRRARPRRGSPASGRRAAAWSRRPSGEADVDRSECRRARRAQRRACAPRPPRSRRRASSPPRAPPGRRPARRARRSARLAARRVPRPAPALPSAQASSHPVAQVRLDLRARRARGAPALGDSALEALDPATGIDQLLLAGVERVAGRADLDVDLRTWSSGS